LNPVERDGLLSSWFTCEINHSHPRLPYRRPAERFTPDNDALVVDVDNITSKFCYLQVKIQENVVFKGARKPPK
ncbi:hypothetical protein AQ665_004968, partial [Salmonella enterica subsp. enterica serovar 4,[5],12:i:-]|nr:hypothetical protein [Salmonella enterica subsp. enterica serovar 4,[5],12:i:-]EEJ0626757.1 hypothetical protein [Salmonella enterica subsp. enterica]